MPGESSSETENPDGRMHVTEPVRATIPVQNGARLSWDPWISSLELHVSISSSEGRYCTIAWQKNLSIIFSFSTHTREQGRDVKKDFKDSCIGPGGPAWAMVTFDIQTPVCEEWVRGTFRSDCAAFIRMTNGRLTETGTFKVFYKH